MIPLQNSKVGVAFAPTSLTTGTAGNYIDCIGYRVLDVVIAASSATTSSVPVSIVLSEGDTTSSFATWTGSTYNTNSTGYPTQVSAVSTAAQDAFAKISVSLLGRKRYIRCVVTGPAAGTTVFGGLFILDRAEQTKTGTDLGTRFAAILPA
jgi:hypothetical protein